MPTAVEFADPTGVDDIAAAIDALMSDIPADPMDQRGRLFDVGLAWVHHPRGRGGLGMARTRQLDVVRQVQDAGVGAATVASGGGVQLAGPTMAVHGSDELCRRLLRRSFTGEDSWCQLFSEPGAGSDMAGLGSCRARWGRVGDRRAEGVDHQRSSVESGDADRPQRP